MPSGRKLEAHSGIGSLMDNPRHVRVRMRGATPPNIYKLSLRGQLFHGVRALRLTPLDERKMYGRDGMLAHSYLLRAKGQSHGCVVFSNYPEFLNAFLKGEVTRLVVVERLENPPDAKLRRDRGWTMRRIAPKRQIASMPPPAVIDPRPNRAITTPLHGLHPQACRDTYRQRSRGL